MNTYQKINTIFKREIKGKKVGSIIEGEYALPEFEYLKNNIWECTEKINGTNIRIIWDGLNVSFKGKTDDADIPKPLLSRLQELFSPKKLLDVFGTTSVIIFGEGYGNNIERGKSYIKDNVDFILFDIFIDPFWLKRDLLEKLVKGLEVDIVPLIGYYTLEEAAEMTRKGFTSKISEDPSLIAEGLVLKTPSGLLFRNGERIITKIKHKDFKLWNH